MPKIFSAALLTASAVGSLLLLPAAPAYAQSEACGRAIDAINAAIDASPNGTLEKNTAKALNRTLLSIDATGAEKDVIAAYANALVDENITDLDPATDELNRVCGG
ncbi:hypothetical protein DFR70_105158 [Nocardia tenerifensis]|uniref:Uncharacterized protein n=1 Tax=Nocardia tenerifensis TaxID=228006 RepID=A0A318K3I8_9NOCA|nr:hypothetical protein [Nocardia tenerifensis]PXX63976.1 hypothetical protein DFR70_105158 [Nocardia tenerifensis]